MPSTSRQQLAERSAPRLSYCTRADAQTHTVLRAERSLRLPLGGPVCRSRSLCHPWVRSWSCGQHCLVAGVHTPAPDVRSGGQDAEGHESAHIQELGLVATSEAGVGPAGRCALPELRMGKWS